MPTSGTPFQPGRPVSAAELNIKTVTYSDNIGSEVGVPRKSTDIEGNSVLSVCENTL